MTLALVSLKDGAVLTGCTVLFFAILFGMVRLENRNGRNRP